MGEALQIGRLLILRGDLEFPSVDGKVARLEKGRTEQEKDFGVEIDSLADIVCFIAIPALTIYQMMNGEMLADGGDVVL